MSASSRFLLAVTLFCGAAAPASALTRPANDTAFAAVAPPDTAITTKFDVDGVTVILRRNPSNEVIAANLYLLGGARQITSGNAGIEAQLLLAS
jgi:hypothetical protein